MHNPNLRRARRATYKFLRKHGIRKPHARNIYKLTDANPIFGHLALHPAPRPINFAQIRTDIYRYILNQHNQGNWGYIPTDIIQIRIMRHFSWKCPSCSLINHPLNKFCADNKCGCKRPGPICAWLVGSAVELERWRNRMTDQKQLEKHARFYNNEKIELSKLTFAEKELRLFELEDIMFEARSRAMAVVDARREDIQRMTKLERDRLINPDFIPSNSRLVTDSVQAVKRTTERRTLAQKTADSMRALGLPEEEIQKIFGKTVSSSLGSSSNVATFNEKSSLLVATSQTNNSKGVIKEVITQPAQIQQQQLTEKKPFNPDDLFG